MENRSPTSEGKTYSGSNFSGGGSKSGAAKRKRNPSENKAKLASANKKKMPGELDPQMESLKAFFSGELEAKLKTNREEIVNDNRETIKLITTKIDNTQNDLNQHKQLMQAELKRVHESINAIKVGPQPGTTYVEAAGCFSGTPAATTFGSETSSSYWRSRRSARIASISGESDSEIWAGLQEFLRNKMRIPRSELTEEDILEAKRVKVGKGRRGNDEILVRFADVETRDRVASYARNLGDFVQDGRPTATFRHDIPVHLAGIHRTMMQYGYAMKQRYGSSFRKNIRFDDVNQSFFV